VVAVIIEDDVHEIGDHSHGDDDDEGGECKLE
jgi:hypothetical protein